MFIREMQKEDLEAVTALEKDVFVVAWNKDDFEHDLCENQFAHLYVLEDQHKVIGYVDVWIIYEQAQIATIGVCQDYQGQGCGHQLMAYALNQCENAHCEVMSLEVRVSNTKAIALYERCGFCKEALRKNYYQDNHEDAYLMIKKIGG